MTRRLSRSAAGSALAALSLVILSVAACASSAKGFENGEPTPILADSGSDDAPACESQTRCSRDLKKVLRGCEGSEAVVEECGPNQGCGDGKCVDACTSAELSKGSIGCSFWTLPADDTLSGSQGSCFAAMIANTWDRPVKLSASLGTEPLDIGPSTYYVERNGEAITYTPVGPELPAGKVAVVFLAQGPDLTPPNVIHVYSPCPSEIVPAVAIDPIDHGTTITRAFHLTSDAPVSAYSIFPYGGAKSYFPTATLLLPVSSWGTSYLSVNAWASPKLGRPQIQIVANDDDTVVRMRPNVDLADGSGVAGIASGGVQSWTLSRGQVLQITQPAETTGSPIESTKPVGMFGGSECTFIPESTQACDVTQQQIPPLEQWGNSYALVPYRPRIGTGVGTAIDAREQVPWRFVGAADGTILTYDPAPPPGAPTTLAAGQVVVFQTDRLVTVKSQDASHPFYAAVFMTGAAAVGGENLGDPDFVNVVPADQYLDRYVFFVDHTYPETTLTVVRRKTAKGFLPVYLECAGEITDFRPLGTSGEFEYAWVLATHHGTPQSFDGGTCGYGRYEAHSDGPFTVTTWGTGYCASYGYTSGAGSRPINDVQAPVVK